jgi:hypothetical protein
MLSSFSFRTLTAVSRFSARSRFHASAFNEAKLSVQGLADLVDLKGQNVLVRVDLNVPLDKAVRPPASMLLLI